MKTIAVMVIWFGAGQYAQFDVERFGSLAECQSARAVILERMDARGGVSNARPDEITCDEVKP